MTILEIMNNDKCRLCIFILFLERHNDFVMGLRDLLHNDLRGFNFDSNLTSDPLWADYWANHVDLPRIREGRLGGQVSSKIIRQKFEIAKIFTYLMYSNRGLPQIKTYSNTS